MMGDIRSKLKPLFRRTTTISSTKSVESPTGSAIGGKFSRSKTSLLLSKSRKPSTSEPVSEKPEEPSHLPVTPPTSQNQSFKGDSLQTPDTSLETSLETPRSALVGKNCPGLTLEESTPEPLGSFADPINTARISEENPQQLSEKDAQSDAASLRPQIVPRRQSLAHSSQNKFLKTLLESDKTQSQSPQIDYFGGPPTISANMLHRKIWVKRPGASATLVSINEDDLVDDVRDMILRKYANSLGRNFDAPDVTLRIVPRDHSHRHSQGERTLGPEEPISRTLDAYYPGGQNVDEALIIDVPQRRTPRNSPRVSVPYYLAEDLRPGEGGTDYFPQMPTAGQHSPHLPANLAVGSSGQTGAPHQTMHSIAILNTGQVPALPSPGGRGTRHAHNAHSAHRPKFGRTHTSSPTVVSGAPGVQSHESLMSQSNGIPAPPSIPTPPIPSDAQPHRAATPPPRPSSPRPKAPHRRSKKPSDHPKLPAGLLDGAVPPINVLIVEDNIINLKLLEAFLKRLKVRWKTAMNGREAVTKWRAGGFHLVLMDIQLPVMNGLDATKEIRRLERLNNIGVFSSSGSNTPTLSPEDEVVERHGKPEGEDSLMNTGLFKSPVIIVALTASSLESDRHEALAAGCNDFLTKPVNFVWLERKVMEWGCMQALIDFDGWRKWKDFSQTQSNAGAADNNNNPSTRKISTANHAHKTSTVMKGTGAAAAAPPAVSTPGRKDKRMGSNPLSPIAGSSGDGASEGEREGKREEGRRGAAVAVAS